MKLSSHVNIETKDKEVICDEKKTEKEEKMQSATISSHNLIPNNIKIEPQKILKGLKKGK
jgi:hypothetical protein